MNDVNYDEFEPVGSPDGGTYSTARPERKRNVGLAIAVSLLVIIVCAAMTVVSLFSVRIEREAGTTSVIFTERNPDISAAEPETEPAAPPEQTDGSAQAPAAEAPGTDGGDMALTELYGKLEPSVVCVCCGSVQRSGLILSEEGYVVTNCSIVRQSSPITVRLYDGTEYAASIAGGDPLSDLAVVKIDGKGLIPAELGDSEALRAGEQVLSIGYSRGEALSAAINDGIISSVSSNLDVEGRTMTVMQTSAGLSVGCCGGPLVNLRGQVVGINAESLGSYVSSDSSFGLAVPIDEVRTIVDELIDHGYIPGRPSIGIAGQSVTDTAQAYYRLPAGVYVEEVTPSSSADRAGIQVGDIITAIDGIPVTSLDELNLIKNRYKSGDTVTISLFRDGEIRDISLVLDVIR